MADISNLQIKFTKIYESNPQYRMLSVDSAMNQMVKDGVLTKAEYDQLIKTSAFGFGFNTDTNMGLSFERTTNPVNKSSSEEKAVEQIPFEPKEFIESLGLDPNSGEGLGIYFRVLGNLEEFNNLEGFNNGKDIGAILFANDLEPNLDNISNIMEILYGVSLRNEEEYLASAEQREKLILQIQAANIMEHFFSLSAQWNDLYTDSLGLFGLGSEGIGYIINKLGLDGENHFQWADSCRKWAEKAGNLSVLNPEKFQEEFKEIYGKNSKYAIDFNEENFKKLLELAKENKIFDEKEKVTPEGKEAIIKAFNFVLNNPNSSTYNQVMLGFGEALTMIATLGWGATTKGGQMLATTSIATFSRAGVAIASKSVNNKLLQGALRVAGNGVKLLGPAVNEGTKLALYTLTTGTAANATNRIVNADSEENSWEKFLQTEAMVMEGAKGSFAFGAFAGIFGSTVTQAVVQRVSKVSSKVTTALADKFAKGAVDANEVFATYLTKSVPTGALEKATVELAAFATDVVGFTAFETALTIAKNLDGFPDDIKPEDITNLLWKEFKGQGYNLGQIKIVSHLVMWMSGSRGARMASTDYLKQNLPQLNGATVQQVGEGYRIKLRSGAIVECKNATEMLSSINLMVRGETALSGKFAKAEKINEFNIFKNKLEIYRNILGFNENEEVTPESLKKHYRELAKKSHSDKGGSDAIMAEINLAHDFYTNNLDRINNLSKEALSLGLLEDITKKSNQTTSNEHNPNAPAITFNETKAHTDKVTSTKFAEQKQKELIEEKEKALKKFIYSNLGKFDLGKISLRINEKDEIIIISEEIMKQVSDKIGQLNKDGGNLINYIKNNLDFDYKNSDDLKDLIEAYVEKYVEDIKKSNNEKAKNGIRETVIKKIESAKKEYENCVNEYEYISLQNFLKEVVDLIPDFSKMIQQAPSWGHLYTLDIHTLKVLQNIFKIINSPELNEKEKTILLYASLFHDIGKVGLDEKLIECHPDKSKEIAERILNGMNIDSDIVDMVCTLIENHEWYGDFNKGKLSMGDIRDIEKKGQQVFKLLKIFAQADIEAIRDFDITSEVGTPLWYYGVSHFDITSSYDLPPIIIHKLIDNTNSSSGVYNIEKEFKTDKALSRVDVNTATDSDILSIWARRKYSSFDEEEYMPRLNKLCTHSIRQDKDQLFVRTIPVDFQLPLEGETFSIGKPSLDNNDITYPAAIARVNISDGGELPKAIIDYIIKDKKNYILSYMVKYAKDGHLTPEILQQHPLPASTVFIIENIQNAKGFDFGELGPIKKTEEDYKATNSIGSKTFHNTVDVNGKSTEVILSSGTKFKQSINQTIEEYEFNIYGIPFKVKVVYITIVE